jgi:hypothetical protein
MSRAFIAVVALLVWLAVFFVTGGFYQVGW